MAIARDAALTRDDYISALSLIRHPEGGYFRETFRASLAPDARSTSSTDRGTQQSQRQSLAPWGQQSGAGEAADTATAAVAVDAEPLEGAVGDFIGTMATVYYMLTADNPQQHMMCTSSHHVYYWQAGGSVAFHVVTPGSQTIETVVVGPRVKAGEVLQLAVTKGSFKAAELVDNGADFALLGQAVAPGSEFRRAQFVSAEALEEAVGHDSTQKMARFVRSVAELESAGSLLTCGTMDVIHEEDHDTPGV